MQDIRNMMLSAGTTALITGLAAGLSMTSHTVGRSTPRKKKVLITPEPYKPIVHYTHRDERQRLINKMTNWQRNQAGLKCKGNWRKLTTEQLEKFANLPHWKAAKTGEI